MLIRGGWRLWERDFRLDSGQAWAGGCRWFG